MTDLRIDQAFFGWSPEDQQLTMLSSSFSTPAEAQYWLHQLQAHIRLEPVPDTVLPVEAFSYFKFDGYAAILRRVGVGASAGRNNSHALIAKANLLSAPVALGLAKWRGWQENVPNSAFMTSMSYEEIENAARIAAGHLKQVPRCERVVTLALAKFLEDPGRPLSIIGCHDEDRLTVVWALRELAEKYVQPALATTPDWSFSTYEDRHDVSVEGLPAIVFLPARPHVGAVKRAVLDLDRRDVRSDDFARAAAFVGELLGKVPAAVSAPVAVSVPTPAVEQKPPVDEPQPVPVPNRRATQPAQAPSNGARDAVAILYETRNLGDFIRQLRRLQQHATPAGRLALRAAFDVQAMDRAARVVEVDIRRELLGGLLAINYGDDFEDLDDPQVEKHAATLLRETQFKQLAMLIGDEENQRREPIRRAILARFSADRDEPSENVGRLPRWLRRRGLRRYLPWIVLAGVLAVLGLVFLGGYLVGRPGPGSPTAGSSAGAVTNPPVTTQPVGSAPVVATVQFRTTPDQQVFLFTQDADGLRAAGRCTDSEGAGVWRCPTPALLVGGPVGLIAYAVPQDQLDDLTNKARRYERVQRDARWGDALTVG